MFTTNLEPMWRVFIVTVFFIFVFTMVFAYFYIPKKYQPKILTWGMLFPVR